MPRYINAEALKRLMGRESFGTPDERWRPESEFYAMIDLVPTAEVWARPVPPSSWDECNGMHEVMVGIHDVKIDIESCVRGLVPIRQEFVDRYNELVKKL